MAPLGPLGPLGATWGHLGLRGAHMGRKSSPETRLGALGEFLVRILDFSGPGTSPKTRLGTLGELIFRIFDFSAPNYGPWAPEAAGRQPTFLKSGGLGSSATQAEPHTVLVLT